MERWNKTTKKYEDSKAINEFIGEIISVFNKHGLSISHEDVHGSFMIEHNCKNNIDRLVNADNNIDT